MYDDAGDLDEAGRPDTYWSCSFAGISWEGVVNQSQVRTDLAVSCS